MRAPDFFLVGAPKCGTTALYAMMGAHPGIFVSPVKEPDFFASDIRAAIFGGRTFRSGNIAGSKDPASERGNVAGSEDPVSETLVADWPRYLDLFRGASSGQRLGEGSVSYLASRVAAAAIHEWCPDARILLVLRDPADRLFSHYSAALAARSTQETFADWLGSAAAREKTDAAPIGPVVAGRYGANLQRYLAVFPAASIHIVWHEDYVGNTSATLRNIFKFLGVDETHRVPVNLRRNETRVRKWGVLKVRSAPRPSSADRALAIRLYEDDIHELSRLTGRDLSRWTSAKG